MVRLAFRKGAMALMSRIIRMRSNGEYSHVELVFSDGLAFSSREGFGKKAGAQYQQIEWNEKDWDFIDLEFITPIEELLIRQWCDGQVGRGYDWRGILRYFFGINMQENNRWFCSEICTAALQQIHMVTRLSVSSVSPQTLYNAVYHYVEALKYRDSRNEL